MPVLIEANSVIVRRDAIEARYPGGLDQFIDARPNATLCMDRHIVRIGFMDPRDVQDFVEDLEARGLTFCSDHGQGDVCVADQQRGLTGPCDWVVVERAVLETGQTIMGAQHPDDDSTDVAVPGGWEFEGSLSDQTTFVPMEDVADRLEPAGKKDGVDVFVDRQTGKRVFLGSTRRPEADAEYDAIARIAQRAMVLADEADRAFESQDADAGGAIYLEVTDELLPEIRQLTQTAHHHAGFAHHAHGLVLRILKFKDRALEQFLKAHEYLPEVPDPLLEIVRCYGELGRPEDAEPYARRGVEVEPESPAAWGNLAITLIELGRGEEARSALDRALELNPDDPINRNVDENFEALLARSEAGDV